MNPRRTLVRRLDRLAARRDHRLAPGFLAYARAVIAFGGAVPTSATGEALARWLAGGWRERA